MHGDEQKQAAMFSYVTLEQRIPAHHPARHIRVLVDRALERMDGELGQVYSHTGRPSIAPERLLRASLLMALSSVRSERQLMERLYYDLLFRWFAGMEMDDPVWDVTVFTENRERLIAGAASQRLLDSVLVEAAGHGLLSEEHFTVDGMLIQAWAAARSFKDKNDAPAPGTGSGSRGAVLLRDKVESTTDPDARLFKKATADKAVPAYPGHVLMENRRGLVVAAKPGQEIMLGADLQYQEGEFIQALRDRSIAPHVSEYTQGNLGKNSLSREERADQRRSISQRKCKLIERAFGWGKGDSVLRKVKLRGIERVDWFHRLMMTACNLVRMRKLIAIPAAAR